MKNQIQKILTNKKITLSIIGVGIIGIVCGLALMKSDNSKDKLFSEIVKYQIQNSTQSKMKNFNLEYFSGQYAHDCPIYVPFIYYSLNPKIEFLGVEERQGTTLYTFWDNRYLNFGYYDPSVMGRDDDIEPIFNDHNDQNSKTSQEVAEIVNIKYCQPVMKSLEKHKNLPIPEIVKNMRRDIWGGNVATMVEQIENMLNSLQIQK